MTRDNCKDINSLPNLKAHLSEYRPIMEQRRETKKGTVKWFQLHWPRQPMYFENAKIAIQSMFKSPSAGYQIESGYFGISANVLVQNHEIYSLKYLLAFLNSRLALYWFYQNGKKRGVGVDIGVAKLREFPIPTINPSDPTDKAMHDRMVALVERMLFLHEEKGQGARARPAAELDAEIRRTDAEIDALVYRLYGLTDEEIRIVEGSSA